MKRQDDGYEPGGGGHDPWRERLSDYLEGDLSTADRRQLEQHLQSCAGCSDVVAGLRAVVEQAETFSRDSEPTRDLWPAIQPRLQPRSPGTWRRVLAALGLSSDGPVGWRAPAFAAAATLLICLAAAGWWLRPATEPGGGDQPGNSALQGNSAEGRGGVEASAEYYDTIAELRRVVRGRLTHDPQVVVVLENNLAVIDAAIAQYQDALAEQPGDDALTRRLEQARERKIEVLRQAASLASEAAN